MMTTILGVLYKEKAESAKGLEKVNLLEQCKDAFTESYEIRKEIGMFA